MDFESEKRVLIDHCFSSYNELLVHNYIFENNLLFKKTENGMKPCQVTKNDKIGETGINLEEFL